LTEPAFDRLLRRLTEAEVEFALIGGLAVNAWGAAVLLVELNGKEASSEGRRTWTSSAAI